MAEESSEEKSEEPTAKRLEKARQDGQVARSPALGVALMMIGAAIFMYFFRLRFRFPLPNRCVPYLGPSRCQF